jgi:hypothetical protein
MQTAQVLSLIDNGHAHLDAALARISRERMSAPGAAGAWSAKDVVAHLTWSEREMVGVLRQRAMVGSGLWNLTQDERNAAVYAENHDRALDDVLAEGRDVFASLRAEIARLSDAEMADPALIAGMPGGLAPWQLLAGNTWKHYEEHLPGLQALAETAG